jgi:hypothetical protein
LISFPYPEKPEMPDSGKMLNSDLGIEHLSVALNRAREQSISWNLRGGEGDVGHEGTRNPPHNGKGADRKLSS